MFSSQELLHCLSRTQCEKQSEQPKYIQVACSTKPELSKEHGSLRVTAQTHTFEVADGQAARVLEEAQGRVQ